MVTGHNAWDLTRYYNDIFALSGLHPKIIYQEYSEEIFNVYSAFFSPKKWSRICHAALKWSHRLARNNVKTQWDTTQRWDAMDRYWPWLNSEKKSRGLSKVSKKYRNQRKSRKPQNNIYGKIKPFQIIEFSLLYQCKRNYSNSKYSSANSKKKQL